MTPVITITFNPCVDKSFETDSMVPEKKLRCTAPRLEPGGGGINVARAIRRLGGKATAIYPSGGYHGALLTEMLIHEGVDTFPVAMLADIRENINVRESATGRQYRFIEPGPVLTEHIWVRCVDAISLVDKGGIIVISGSIPPGRPPDLWKRIRQAVDKKSARLVVDVQGEALQHALEQGVYLIKPSEEELAVLAGASGGVTMAPEKMAAAIVARGQAQAVVISRGAAGAALVTAQGASDIPAPEVQKQSSVGAGDCLVAGIISSLCQKMELVEAVRFGVACGAAAVMNPGTELFHLTDAEALFARMVKETQQPKNNSHVSIT